MIYLTEAHADDVWPMGYGIKQPTNLEERWANFDRLMEKHPKLGPMIDYKFCDKMSNDFNSLTGAWPECYFYTRPDGTCQFQVDINQSLGLETIEQIKTFAVKNDLLF